MLYLLAHATIFFLRTGHLRLISTCYNFNGRVFAFPPLFPSSDDLCLKSANFPRSRYLASCRIATFLAVARRSSLSHPSQIIIAQSLQISLKQCLSSSRLQRKRPAVSHLQYERNNACSGTNWSSYLLSEVLLQRVLLQQAGVLDQKTSFDNRQKIIPTSGGKGGGEGYIGKKTAGAAAAARDSRCWGSFDTLTKYFVVVIPTIADPCMQVTDRQTDRPTDRQTDRQTDWFGSYSYTLVFLWSGRLFGSVSQ